MSEKGDTSGGQDIPVAYAHPVGQGQQVPAWAVTIGILSIVWASLELICVPAGLLICHVAPARPPAMELPGWWWIHTALASVINTAKGLLLLAGGIQLLRGRRSARVMHLVCGWAAAALVVMGMLLTASVWTMWQGMPLIVFMVVVSSPLISLAYPIFVIVWFSRGAIRREMAAWRPAPV